MLQSSPFRSAVGGIAAAALLNASFAPFARANLPTGAQVVHGNVAITQAGGAMSIQQASRNAIVNWQSFNIGVGNSVRLEQAGADAAMLARVVGGDASQLLGSLKADGKLFLINQRGVIIGEGAVIDAAGFLGSTLDVTDAEFLAGGAMTFKGNSDAGILNLGTITAREGNVMLFAHSVKNAGEIVADKGTVGLGAGTEVLLAASNASGFVIKTNLGTTAEKTGVDNSGVIAAAQAQLEAAGGSIYELAVNQSGVVRATGSEVRNGRVLLTAGGGTVGVSGEVSAQNENGSGGEILVGGDFRGQNADVANAARTVVTQTAKLDASAANDAAPAGRVIVWADGATRFFGSLKATGAGGGFAEVSGKRWLDFNPASTIQLGRNGTLLLDPDALIISDGTNSGTSTSGPDPFTFGVSWEVGDIFDFEVPPPSILNVTILQDQLALSNVILDTSTAFGDVSFNVPVTWSNNNTLTVRSGNSIHINADITGGADSTLEFYTGIKAWGIGELGFPPIQGEAWLAEDATIRVGALVYGANEFAEYPAEIYTPDGDTPSTGVFFADGNINVNTLRMDLSGGDAGIVTNGINNTIRAFRATGGHSLSAYVANHNGDLDVTLDEARSRGSSVQFVTPGTLTLTSGSLLTFDEREDDPNYKGTVVLASTGGAVVNEAGADVFGGATRFIIYSNTTSATKKGGLVGTVADTFNHAYDKLEWFDDNESRFLFTALSGAPILTYTADDLSRAYGAGNPAFTFTRAGLIESVIDDVTGTPTLSSSATQSSGVGEYTISIGLGTLASSNYDFEFENGTLTIERAPLTVTANDKARRVNLANPDFDATFAGFVLDEDESVLGGTLTFATPVTSASPAGTYAIVPAGLTSANYEITFFPGTLTLTETVTLLISANNAWRNYGAANPTFTASYSGFAGGDTESVVTGLQFSTTATQSSGIGSYTITPFGASADGYEISYATGTLTIERAPLTVSIPNQSRSYGDENDFTINFNGLVNGETSAVVSGLSVSSAATKTSNVGSYAIEAFGATADNYSISYSSGTLTVMPAPLAVSIDPATRRYGDPDPVFTHTVTGLKNGDSESLVTVNDLASLASATAGIGDYGIVGFPFVSSSNYSVATQVSGTLTIAPRPLTIRADNTSRIYGDANPMFTASYEGLASFDTPALFGDIGLTTQATPTSGVGAWGITFGTVANQNYTITREFGTLTITPAPLTFDALLDVSRLYGRANPSLLFPAVGGLKNDDTVTNLGLQFSEVPAATADVGRYTYSVTSNNPNYSFVAPTAEFRIDPAPLTVAIGSSGRIYGDANPASYDLIVTGLAFDHAADSVIGVANPTEARTDVGIYAVGPVLKNMNYVIDSFTGGAFVISPRVLTLTAADRTKVYGDWNPFFFGDITGFLEGDSALDIIINHAFTTVADRSSGVGSYAIRPSAQTTTRNYITSAINGTLTITPAPLTVTIADATRVYGVANPSFHASGAQGLKNGDTLDVVELTFTTPATTTSDTGFYSIFGAGHAQNYAVRVETGRLTITRASASIAVNSATRAFGDHFAGGNPFSATYAGFLAADEALARGNWQLFFDDEQVSAPGAHAISVSEMDVLVSAALRKNYDITFASGTLTITPRPLTITAPNRSFSFGSSVPSEVALPTPDVPAGAPAFTVVGNIQVTSSGRTLVPEIVPGAGVTREELDHYFDFDLQPGAVSIVLDDSIDITKQVDPSLTDEDNKNNTIFRDFTPSDETIEVDKGDTLTLAANPYVDYSTKPLTQAEFAAYFGSFAQSSDKVKSALAGSYAEFLAEKGVADSAYEEMDPAARALLADWMSGDLSDEALRTRVAAGDTAALAAFSFMLPTLVNQTRAKAVEDMTPLDRQVLGRLADLTEQRRTATLQAVQQKYDAMMKAAEERSTSSAGMTALFLGPGDFKEIVDSAAQEALGMQIGVSAGAAAGSGAAAIAALTTKVVLKAIFPTIAKAAALKSASVSTVGASVGGPAVVVTAVIVLAVRATQISESMKNEEAFNAFMASWSVGQEITSISELKSSAMDNDMKISTLALTSDLFKSGQ